MDALVSGQAAVAVLFEYRNHAPVQTLILKLDQAGEPTPVEQGVSQRLLHGCTDLVRLVNTNLVQVRDELELLWAKDRALHLMIMVLDGKEDLETQAIALECLEEMFGVEDVRDFVAFRLYGSPIPDKNNLEWAFANAKFRGYKSVEGLLSSLKRDMADIVGRCEAWDELPLSLFESDSYKLFFREKLIGVGAFYKLIVEYPRTGSALLSLHVNKQIQGLKNYRQILQAWVMPFLEGITKKSLELPPDIALEKEFEERFPITNGVNRNPYGSKQNVDRQKPRIKELIEAGDDDRALAFTKELVDSQRSTSKPEHIAKTLCDLAMHAKHYQNFSLQLRLSEWAVEEASTDAWSHIQLGDAYKLTGNLDKSLEHFNIAYALGGALVALNGQAEAFRESGDLESAITLYESCISRFPADPVAYNAYATALASSGRLLDSLDMYDSILELFPYDPVSRCGKATVLRELGRYEEALVLVRIVLEGQQNILVAGNLEATILRQMGRVDEAIDRYNWLDGKYPKDIFVGLGLAGIYKDLLQLDRASEAYQAVSAKYLRDTSCRLGLAGIHKLQGKHDLALMEYDRILEFAPWSMPARNGKAALFVVQGRYRDAYSLLPQHPPVSQGDWVAYHVYTMGLLKEGYLEEAISRFENGLENSPWFHGKEFFRTSLAAALNKKRNFEKAIMLMEEDVSPVLKPARQLVLLHAYSCAANKPEASKIYDLMQRYSNTVVSLIRDNTYRFANSTSLLTRPAQINRSSVNTFDLITSLAA